MDIPCFCKDVDEDIFRKRCDSMEFPKLTLPPEDFTVMDSRVAELTPGTFANKFHELLSEYEKEGVTAHAKEGAPKVVLSMSVCQAVNDHFQTLRKKLDREMQRFLLEHDGVIDSWPHPESYTILSSRWAKHDPMVFDYFGTDYEALDDCHVTRKSDQRIYRYEYYFEETKPFQKMLAKEEDLKRQVVAGKAHRNPLVPLGLVLGLLFCVFQALSILGEAFFGTGKDVVTLLRSSIQPVEGVLGFLEDAALYFLALPTKIYLGVGSFFQGFLYTMIGIVLAAFCLLGAYACYCFLSDRWKYIQDGKKAAKELKALPTSPEYLNAKQDEEDDEILALLNNELAKQWHRAWYEWVQEHVSVESNSKHAEASATEEDSPKTQQEVHLEE